MQAFSTFSQACRTRTIIRSYLRKRSSKGTPLWRDVCKILSLLTQHCGSLTINLVDARLAFYAAFTGWSANSMYPSFSPPVTCSHHIVLYSRYWAFECQLPARGFHQHCDQWHSGISPHPILISRWKICVLNAWPQRINIKARSCLGPPFGGCHRGLLQGCKSIGSSQDLQILYLTEDLLQILTVLGALNYSSVYLTLAWTILIPPCLDMYNIRARAFRWAHHLAAVVSQNISAPFRLHRWAR